MLNLYKNAIETKSFIGLVAGNVKENVKVQETESRRIVTGFAIVSLLVVSMIVNGTQSQSRIEAQKLATIASYTSVA